MLKSILILVALAVGLAMPVLDAYTFTLRPFLMILLFFSFLEVRLGRQIFRRQQAYATVLLIPIGLGVYFLGRSYDEDLGLTLLLMGLAPTAVITPVLAQLMQRNVGYLVGTIIISHALFALTVPLILPWLLGIRLSLAALGDLVFTIGSTVAVPLLLAQLVRRYLPRIQRVLSGVAGYVFALFLSNIAVAAGSLSYYLHYDSETGVEFIVITAAAIGVLMVFNFTIGSRLCPRGHRVEGSLAMGRKNTMLSIWIALEYINPLTVLGPMLYILLQNVFVAGQIVYVARRA